MRSSFIVDKKNKDGKPRITVLGFAVALILILSTPLLTIVSVNTLFGDLIGYDIKSYAAISYLMILVLVMLRLSNGQTK